MEATVEQESEVMYIPEHLVEGELYVIRRDNANPPNFLGSTLHKNAMFVTLEDHSYKARENPHWLDRKYWLAFGIAEGASSPLVRVRIPLVGCTVKPVEERQGRYRFGEVACSGAQSFRIENREHSPIVSQFLDKWGTLVRDKVSSSGMQQKYEEVSNTLQKRDRLERAHSKIESKLRDARYSASFVENTSETDTKLCFMKYLIK